MDPPPGVEPAELFLLLLRRPRPWWPTDVVPDGRVVALTATERACIEAAATRLPPGAPALYRARHEVALCLHDATGPVFASADEAGDLTPPALARLVEAVNGGLAVCCPEYGYCPALVWHMRLLEGARAMPMLATALGGCVDEGYRRYHERPDRWFGVPQAELTDGQWMAYRAARAYLHEQHERQERQAASRSGR